MRLKIVGAIDIQKTIEYNICMRKMNKRIQTIIFLCLLTLLTGCAGKNAAKTEIQVFTAASLDRAMTEISENYEENHPDVNIICNADSSGKLRTQIEEGFDCDIFFAASESDMDILKEKGFLLQDTRYDVLRNQLVLIGRKDCETRVSGLININEAQNIALASESVPAGRYTRIAMANLDIIPNDIKPSEATTKDISEILCGPEISEMDNVSKVLTSVKEGICEVGTTYISDVYGYEDEIRIIEKVPSDLTGEIIYPISGVINKASGEDHNTAVHDFIKYILSEDAKKIFEKYGFMTNVK